MESSIIQYSSVLATQGKAKMSKIGKNTKVVLKLMDILPPDGGSLCSLFLLIESVPKLYLSIFIKKQ